MYFLNINKPLGITSFDVIKVLRKKLKTKKIGHSGTLDPLATGVMQVAVGDATKLLDYLDSDKTYVATFKLGYVTDTYDAELEPKFVKAPNISKDELIKVLNSFVGISEQIPPKYSAIKQNGKKLCDLARNNIDIDIKPRAIEIYSIKLLEFNDYDLVKIEVRCKKGTYIRSLVNDIGLKIGCGAFLTELIRTQAGSFKFENSNSLDKDEYTKIDPISAINLPKIEISNSELEAIFNGNFIENKTKLNDCKILLTYNKILVSIAEISDNLIKPKKNFKRI